MSNETRDEVHEVHEASGVGGVIVGAADDTVVQYPSSTFPAAPDFWLRVPARWTAVPVADAEMAMRDPVAVDGFHVNVIVRVHRVAATETVTDALVHSVALGDAGGMEVIDEEVHVEPDTAARWLLVRFRGPNGQVLLARHLLVCLPAGGPVAHVVTAVGTFPASVAGVLGPRMDRIVGSLRLATLPRT
jgi:hypothetical protein